MLALLRQPLEKSEQAFRRLRSLYTNLVLLVPLTLQATMALA